MIDHRSVGPDQRLECRLVHVVGGDFLRVEERLVHLLSDRIDVLAADESHGGDDPRLAGEAEPDASVLYQHTAERGRRFLLQHGAHHVEAATWWRRPAAPAWKPSGSGAYQRVMDAHA